MVCRLFSGQCAEWLSVSTWCQWPEIISHHACVKNLEWQALVSARALYHPCSPTDQQHQGKKVHVHSTQSKGQGHLSDFAAEGTWIRGHWVYWESFQLLLSSRISSHEWRCVEPCLHKDYSLHSTKTQVFSCHSNQVVFSRTCNLTKWKSTQCNHVCIFSSPLGDVLSAIGWTSLSRCCNSFC